MKPAPGKKIVARSIRELARKLGRSHSTVASWMESPEWSLGRGPWDARAVDRINLWSEQRTADSRADPDLRKAKIHLLIQQVADHDLADAVDDGKLIERAKVENAAVTATIKLRNGILGIPSLLASSDLGTVDGVMLLLADRLNELLEEFHHNLKTTLGVLDAYQQIQVKAGGDATGDTATTQKPADGGSPGGSSQSEDQKTASAGGASPQATGEIGGDTTAD